MFLGGFRPCLDRIGLSTAGVKHLLIANTESNSTSSFYIVVSMTKAGANDLRSCFIVYSTTNFNKVITTTITPLDGRTYEVIDYTYNGVVYKALDVSDSGSNRGTLYVYGLKGSGIDNVIIGG